MLVAVFFPVILKFPPVCAGNRPMSCAVLLKPHVLIVGIHNFIIKGYPVTCIVNDEEGSLIESRPSCID